MKTSSGATAVQIVWKYRRGSRQIEHLGSAHSQAEVELLQAAAAQRIAAGQDELPLGIPATSHPAAVEVTSTAYHQLWHVEHSFRMSKTRPEIPTDLLTDQGIDRRPPRRRVAALAVSHWIETRTDWTIKRFVQTFRRYRQVTLNTGTQQITGEQPLPDDERAILARLHGSRAH